MNSLENGFWLELVTVTSGGGGLMAWAGGGEGEELGEMVRLGYNREVNREL